MTHLEYRKALERLGLSQLAAGRVLGVKPRTAQNYALGATPIPLPVAKLLRLMLRRGIKPEEVESI